MKSKTWLAYALLSIISAACSQEKSEKDDAARDEESASPATPEGSVQKIELDGSSKEAWSGFDFDAGLPISKEALGSDRNWDIAVKRTSIKLNGPGVKILLVQNQDFASISSAPAEGFIGDQSPSDPSKETSGLAFHQGESWYSYDPATHVVKSRDQVYLLQSSAGQLFKLKILDYYGAERLPAYFQIQWQRLDAGVAP